MDKSHDAEYEDKIITAVSGDKERGWVITCDGWCFSVPKGDIEPRVGNMARFYGAGIGSIVRGLDIRGIEVFYRTPEEQKAKNQKDSDDRDLERRAEYLEKESQLDADYESLPDNFKRRLDRFRANRSDFRWEFESYEMMCCKEAVSMAAKFPTEAELKAFSAAGYEKQKAMYPEVSDGHSGNSFGFSVRLAYWQVVKPENVEIEHGALCPLVGCRDYGCVPEVKGKAAA